MEFWVCGKKSFTIKKVSQVEQERILALVAECDEQFFRTLNAGTAPNHLKNDTVIPV